MIRPALSACLILALSACGEGDTGKDPLAGRDPAITGALSDPIMAEPDLAGQSRADSAISGGGPANAEVPPDKRTPEEAEKARIAAREVVGSPIEPAPAAGESKKESRLARALTPEAAAAALKLGPPHCPARLGYAFGWVARLPAALPAYPRSHARMAAGTDDAGCKLRAVRLVTPVPVNEVIDFYHAVAAKAGLAPARRKEGADEAVTGTKGAAAFAAYARQGSDGMTEIDLITSGF